MIKVTRTINQNEVIEQYKFKNTMDAAKHIANYYGELESDIPIIYDIINDCGFYHASDVDVWMIDN